MSNNSKVKGLLKGLRFISQIFDNEKEPEIEIGHPTDVKHVAHIGWDGNQSDNPPSWMNEFESIPGFSSAPLNLNGDILSKGPGNSVTRVPEDSTRRGSRTVDCQGQQKHLAKGNMRESQAKEKSDKPRQPKKSSKQPKDSSNVSKSTEQPILIDSDSFQLQGNDLPHKKSRSKMTTKDASIVGGSGSSKSRSRGQTKDLNLNQGPPSKSRNKQRSFEEDRQIERGSNESILRNYPNYSN